MEKLNVNTLYEIEGKVYKLCKSEFEHSTHGSKIKKFYFKKPTFADAEITKKQEEKNEN